MTHKRARFYLTKHINLFLALPLGEIGKAVLMRRFQEFGAKKVHRISRWLK